MDKLWFLAEVDIFQDLTPADLVTIAARAPMQSVSAGADFFTPERVAVPDEQGRCPGSAAE